MKLSKYRSKPRRHARVLVAAAIAVAMAALPATGNATQMNVGSDLTKSANLVEAHGADAVFWNTSIDGLPGAMPADGQITVVRIKGAILDSPTLRRNPQRPDPQFHVQVLHPVGGGRLHVMLSSAPFRVPTVTVGRDGSTSGNTQAINSYAPINLCVQKGDYVDFNDIGGHEWSWGGLDGMHFQIFGQTPNSTVGFYTKNNGTNNNSEWAPLEMKQGQELLMQAQLSTGAHATDFCPGGFKQHIFKGLEVKKETVSVSGGAVKLHGTCPGPTYGGCKGVLVLKANVAGREVSLGGTTFVVKPAFRSSLQVKLSKESIALIKKAKGVTAQASADGHDDPLHDRRAKPGVPVQAKTTASTVTIRPG